MKRRDPQRGRRGRWPGSLWVETRSCYHCLRPGHLRAHCPLLRRESELAAELAAEIEQQDQTEMLVMKETADPLPIADKGAKVRWQGDAAGSRA